MRKRVREDNIYPRSILQNIESLLWDIRYGGKLLDDEKVSPYYTNGCYHTQSIEYEELKKVFADVKLSPSDVIMDVGCGRGRIFNYLLKNNFKGTMYGVEIDREIALFTKNRLKKYKNIKIINDDAIKSTLPDVSIYFLFCPFDEHLTELFIKQIELTHKKVKVIYYFPRFIKKIITRKGWCGDEKVYYSKIRKRDMSCYYLEYNSID